MLYLLRIIIITDSLEEQLKISPIHLWSAPHVMYHVSLEPGQRTINSSSALRSITAPLVSSRSAQPTTTTELPLSTVSLSISFTTSLVIFITSAKMAMFLFSYVVGWFVRVSAGLFNKLWMNLLEIFRKSTPWDKK